MKTKSIKAKTKQRKAVELIASKELEVVPKVKEQASKDKKAILEIKEETPDVLKSIPTETDSKSDKKHSWKSSLALLFLFIPLGLYFHFGMLHLAQFETADEYRWIYPDSRIPRYWDAMERHDWKDTMVNDKPGIATAIISGLGIKNIGVETLGARYVERNKYSFTFSPEASEYINFSVRFPLLVFNGLLAVLWYFILRRLFDDNWTALLACSLILLSPILIGISQIVNPDALLWSTAFTAIISFLVFLKHQKWYDALISGIFLGLALLSKYTAVMIIPYEFALILAYLVFSYDDSIKEESFRKRAIRYAIFYPLSVALGFMVYALLMPAVFQMTLKQILKINDAFGMVYPYLKYIGIITAALLAEAIILKSWVLRKILFPFKYLWNASSRIFYGGALIFFSLAIWNWNRGNFWGIPDIPFDAGSDKAFRGLDLIHKIFLELRPFIFSLAGIVTALLILTWAIHIFKKKTDNAFVVFALTLLMPFFYFAVIEAGYLTTIRYSIMLYPLAATLAAIGIIEILRITRLKIWLSFAVFSIVILASVISLKGIQPFYFNYANDLLPKNNVISSAWGYGGYEAAQYIKTQTSAPKNLIIWTDYGGFCQFFAGLCIMDSDIKWVGYSTTNRIDYYISTKRGAEQLKSTWAKLLENTNGNPEWELQIDGRPDNYIRVYKVESSNFKSDNWWKQKKDEKSASQEGVRKIDA